MTPLSYFGHVITFKGHRQQILFLPQLEGHRASNFMRRSLYSIYVSCSVFKLFFHAIFSANYHASITTMSTQPSPTETTNANVQVPFDKMAQENIA